MCKNRAAIWVLVSVVWLCSGRIAAETPEIEAKAAPHSTEEPREAKPPAAPEGEVVIGSGVVVESVGKGSAFEKAGLQVGDLIVAWERYPNPPSNPEGARGRIVDYGDWVALKEEQAPRGTVSLEIQRGPDHRLVEVPLAIWDLRTRPNLTSAESSCFEELAGHVQGGGNPADSCWSTVFPLGRSLRREGALFWLGSSLAKSLARTGRTKEAHNFLSEVIAKLSVTEIQVLAYWRLGGIHVEVGDLETARNAFRQAARLVEIHQGKNLLWARCKTALFATYLLDDTSVQLYEELRELLVLRRSLAPGSADVAGSLNNLATVESESGDFEAAAEHYREALNIFERLDRPGEDLATILSNYSTALFRVGDLAQAEQAARRALEIIEQVGARTKAAFSALSNLGVIIDEKGDLDEAEMLYSRALSLVDSNSELRPYKLAALTNLSELNWSRGEYERAESLLSEAFSELGSTFRETGRGVTLLNNLGIVKKRKGEYSEAKSFFLRAKQLAEKLSKARDHWAALENLALLDVSEGRASSAIEWVGQALRVVRNFGSGSLFEARSLITLSEAYLLQKRYSLAEANLVRALSILKAYAGQPIEKAQAFYFLATIRVKQGRPREAADLFEKVAQATEHAANFSGGRFQEVLRYRDLLLAMLDGYIGSLVETGELHEAFRALETKRARSFAALLQERDIRFNEGESGELAAERQLLERKYDRLQIELLRRSEAGRHSDLEDILKSSHDIEARLSQVSSRIKLASPRLASLVGLHLPDADELRKAAPAGVLLLSFTAEGERSYIFAMASDIGLRCVTINAGAQQLLEKISRFRSLLAESSGESQLSTIRKTALDDAGRQLYRLLLEPVVDLIDSHERVLIMADGPLQLLPFGALRLWLPRDSREVLAGWKPFHFAPSLSTYLGPMSGRRPAAVEDDDLGRFAFAGFGEPFAARKVDSAAPETLAIGGRRAARLRSFYERDPLTYGKREVEGIASLFPADQVKVFVGEQATEESARIAGGDSRIVHFATHAFLDNRFPLSSSLLLATPTNPRAGTGNGLLQVWEIFEQMRLSADLIVLSGCETALGEVDGGEGLMGLARAFQYAGARSVLASLWKVQDQATSELMIRFYKHLRAGLPKDQALQAAQQELIRGPIEVTNEKGEREIRDFSSPYYWAGFQLYGDWQ